MTVEIPPELHEVVTALSSMIIDDGRVYQEILPERVPVPEGSTVNTLDRIAELLTHQWAIPGRPNPQHDWHVHYSPDRNAFIAVSRHVLQQAISH